MSRLIIFIILNIFSTFVTAAEDVCPCINTKENNPVCASDNVTYTNPGEVSCRNKCEGLNLEIIENKPCPCNCAVSRELFKICADDDNTYVNPSAVKCHNKCNYHKIRIVAYRPCRENDVALAN